MSRPWTAPSALCPTAAVEDGIKYGVNVRQPGENLPYHILERPFFVVKQGRVRPGQLSCFQATSGVLSLGLSPLPGGWIMVRVWCPLEQRASSVFKTPGLKAFLGQTLLIRENTSVLQVLVNKWFKADTEAHKDSDSPPQEFMPTLILTWTIPGAAGCTGAACSSLSVTAQSHCLDMHFGAETVRMESEIAVVNPAIQRETCALHSVQMCPLGAAEAPYFPVAREISASFNHITTSDQQPWRAEISLCFLMYINCPILSKHDCSEFSEKPGELMHWKEKKCKKSHISI